MKKFLLAVCALMLLLPFAGLGTASAAPNLITPAGMNDLIKKNKGKVVIVNFFATWCPPCRMELPILVKMQKKYQGKAVFVGLTVDDASTIDKVDPFLKKMGVTYPVYRAGEVVKKHGVTTIPFNLFYDKAGKLVLSGAGVVEDDDLEDILKQLTN